MADWEADVAPGYSTKRTEAVFTYAFLPPVKIYEWKTSYLTLHNLYSHFTIHSYCALQKRTKSSTQRKAY